MAQWDPLLWTDRYTYMTEKTDTHTWLKTLPSRNFVSGRVKFINKCFQMFHRIKTRLVFEDTNVTMSLKYVPDICFLKGSVKTGAKATNQPINRKNIMDGNFITTVYILNKYKENCTKFYSNVLLPLLFVEFCDVLSVGWVGSTKNVPVVLDTFLSSSDVKFNIPKVCDSTLDLSLPNVLFELLMTVAQILRVINTKKSMVKKLKLIEPNVISILPSRIPYMEEYFSSVIR